MSFGDVLYQVAARGRLDRVPKRSRWPLANTGETHCVPLAF